MGWAVEAAGGRAKRRRLAQALLARPGVLTDGRSPAPESVGKLMVRLRDAGAVNISAPLCAECGKPMRAFQRRGQDWYCGVHGPQAAACAGCGNIRPIAVRDRHHRPYCWACPLPAEPDPVQAVSEVVAGIDPALPGDLVAAGARRRTATRSTSPAGVGRDRPA